MGADQFIGAVVFVGHQTLESQSLYKRLSKNRWFKAVSCLVACGAGEHVDFQLMDTTKATTQISPMPRPYGGNQIRSKAVNVDDGDEVDSPWRP